MPALGHVYWRGFLRLQLVSINIEIYSAAENAAEISFNQIHKPSGKRIRYEKVVPGIGPVDTGDIVKGYQVEPDVYVTLEPEEIDAIRLDSKKTIDMVQFVDSTEIDARYFERPYYIVPKDEVAAEGYLVIREALSKSHKMGIAQVTMHGREHLVAVGPLGKGLAMYTLRYSNELRSSEKYYKEFESVKYDRQLVSLASELIERNSAPFKPEKFKDAYAVSLAELVRKKARGQRITIAKPAESAPSNVVDLMQALKKSLGKGKPEKTAATTKRRSTR